MIQTFWDEFQGVTENSEARSLPLRPITDKLVTETIAAVTTTDLDKNILNYSDQNPIWTVGTL